MPAELEQCVPDTEDSRDAIGPPLNSPAVTDWEQLQQHRIQDERDRLIEILRSDLPLAFAMFKIAESTENVHLRRRLLARVRKALKTTSCLDRPTDHIPLPFDAGFRRSRSRSGYGRQL